MSAPASASSRPSSAGFGREAEAVGLEPHRTARELGRSRIAAAGLSSRIALRDERVEMLGERAAYDLAFLPQPFLPERRSRPGCRGSTARCAPAAG